MASMSALKIEELIGKFNAHGERRPMLAAQAVAKYGKAAVPPLITALKRSTNVRIRRWAAYALRFTKDSRTVAPLKQALNDPNMSVRLLAMESLEVVAGAKAGKFLLPLLKDESGGVRGRTVDALARLRYKPAAKLLRAALKDEKDYIRRGATRALELIQA